jgi:urease accessory protein
VTWRAAAALAATLALLPDAALAHAPIPGVGAFWNGVLHPLLVPVHLLALVGAGIVLGQNAPRASRPALPLFAACLAAALVAAGPAGTPPAALLAVALAAGLLVAAGRGLPALVVAVAAAAGVAVGLDSAPLEAASGEARLAAAGTFAGALIVVILSGGIAAATAAPWQRIAVRTLGSWIAAVSLIALALAVSAPEALS